jgi:hypothetical protein
MNAELCLLETSSPPAADASSLVALYAVLSDNRQSESDAATSDAYFDERPVRLASLGELHFLDQHACLLLARAHYTPTIVLRDPAPTHLCARIAANIICASATPEGERVYDYYAPAHGAGLDYEHGILLRRALDVHRVRALWHNYLTSRDRTIPVAPVAATLDGKFPHLLSGFVTGVDLFNCGEFYRAHEEWESLWMRLDANVERSLAQGLIQLAGAHIHRLKARSHEAQKLFASARRHLAEARSLEWIDVDSLLAESGRTILTDVTATIPLPSIPLRDTHTNIPRKHR